MVPTITNAETDAALQRLGRNFTRLLVLIAIILVPLEFLSLIHI